MNEMTCERCRESLESYLGGDLDATRMHEVAAHLSECEPCTAAYESTRRVVGDLGELADAFVPEVRFQLPAESTGGRRAATAARLPRLALAAALAAALTVAALATTALTIPALAAQIPGLPLSRELVELRQERETLERENEALASEVEQLKVRLKEIDGVEVPEVDSAEPGVPPEVNDAIQSLVMDFVKKQYARDLEGMKELATERLAEEMTRDPDTYLRRGKTLVFAQITTVGRTETGSYVVFVRLSDAEFSDSTYQEDFEVKKVGDLFKVERCDMDA